MINDSDLTQTEMYVMAAKLSKTHVKQTTRTVRGSDDEADDEEGAAIRRKKRSRKRKVPLTKAQIEEAKVKRADYKAKLQAHTQFCHSVTEAPLASDVGKLTKDSCKELCEEHGMDFPSGRHPKKCNKLFLPLRKLTLGPPSKP